MNLMKMKNWQLFPNSMKASLNDGDGGEDADNGTAGIGDALSIRLFAWLISVNAS